MTIAIALIAGIGFGTLLAGWIDWTVDAIDAHLSTLDTCERSRQDGPK